jgi:hypothetical protein
MGFWINVNNGYNPGLRHYTDQPPARTTANTLDFGGSLSFEDSAGPALCGRYLLNHGYYLTDTAGARIEDGGLNALPVVNLLARGLCNRCVKAYLSRHRDLAINYEATKRIRVDSR